MGPCMDIGPGLTDLAGGQIFPLPFLVLVFLPSGHSGEDIMCACLGNIPTCNQNPLKDNIEFSICTPKRGCMSPLLLY